MSRAFLVVGLMALVSACSGSPCAHLETAETSLRAKIGSCSDTVTFSKDTCDQNISKCSGDDQNKLDTYADCIAALPDCTSANEQDFDGQLLACTPQISASCAAAVQ